MFGNHKSSPYSNKCSEFLAHVVPEVCWFSDGPFWALWYRNRCCLLLGSSCLRCAVGFSLDRSLVLERSV